MMRRTAVVIGAGLIGTTTAWFLAQRDFDVTVVERRAGPGLETSFANGGLLTPSQADPWNAPGILARAIRWLGRENSPLLLRPQAVPGMLGWGWRFLRASRPRPHLQATRAILQLALYSLRTQDTLDEQLALDYHHLHHGTLKIFRDRRALAETRELIEQLRPLGLEARVLDPKAAAKLEPLLADTADELFGAVHYPKDGSGDAYQFTAAMQQHAAKAGVQFRFNTDISGFQADNKSVSTLRSSQGDIHADAYIVAAGSYSPKLTRSLQLPLPVYPAKGYSLTFRTSPARQLQVPVVDFEQKIVITPLGDRVRIAGTAEFNGYDTEVNLKRSTATLQQALRLLPKLAEDAAGEGKVTHWTGLRPMTCDGPPILGATPYTNLYLNTGHGPLGWTLCAGSAQMVADIVAGRQPAVNPEDYSFRRFSR
ncbi:MAG: D-amino acid dehydrogenase [Gammaproteobacteria bacterium]|nr:D-amino acid dehydrogenase [Gammaproteobacteria bacterium]MDE1984263.1 D-amino acid dehydrogenase [Gammaproteobacteria bacterium]